MFRSLYGRLATIFLLVFAVIAVGITWVVGHMLPDTKLRELVAGFTIGGAAFTLVVGLVLFRLLAQRLERLAEAMQAWRESGFRALPMLADANPRGDEISRLEAAFAEAAARMGSQLAQLEASDRHRRELLANVSHDLRTPLAAMQGYLETLLLKERDLSPRERRDYLEVAHKHCERLTRLVANLFELTKLDAREITPALEPVSLAELAQDVVQKYDLPAREKRIDLAARLDEGVPMVQADVSLMEHVLQNLIENALRHTPAGGSVRVAVARDAAGVAVRVADTGAGIPAADLPHVFDRLYRAGAEHAEHTGGAGLGLAIVKRILELHGSGIEVASEPGHGTTFRFVLPYSG